MGASNLFRSYTGYHCPDIANTGDNSHSYFISSAEPDTCSGVHAYGGFNAFTNAHGDFDCHADSDAYIPQYADGDTNTH
jgi:hypothetical protein